MADEYTPKEVAELLGLSVAEVRRCLRAGFLRPGAAPASSATKLTFQDVVALRRAAELVRARIQPHRVRRALRSLRDQLPSDRPLSSVQMSVEHGAIVAREGERVWEPLSGQLHLSFEAKTQTAPSTLVTRPAVEALHLAESTYEHACELDERGQPGAEAAYLEVLTAAPTHRDARINLGRLLHGRGRPAEAVIQYQHVLALGPHALASFNLGVAHEDLGQTAEATRAYEAAIAADASCEDAYFNLARIHERQGDRAAALRALRTYRNLTRAR